MKKLLFYHLSFLVVLSAERPAEPGQDRCLCKALHRKLDGPGGP